MSHGQALTLKNGHHERHRQVKLKRVLVQLSKSFQRLIPHRWRSSDRLSSRVQRANFNSCLQELKSKLTLSILWKDAHTRGLMGVAELREFDLPFKTARVGDLFPLLNDKINSKYQGDCKFREVESLQLYGARLSPHRLLDPLIPELGLAPRFVAVMRVYPKKVPRTNISVFVKTLTNNNILVHCESNDTVGSLKGKIQDKLKITRDFQRLVYAGKQLEDHLALSTYGITNTSRIHLTRMMNGGGASRIFADLSSNSLLHLKDFAREAPKYRLASRGLNIEGICENPECTAFREWIICPKRFQEFNLMRDEDTKCPMCQSKVIPLTCGFYNCTWKFDGIQADNGNSIISQWKDARGYKYHRFDADESVKWESLLIVAKPLGAEPCPICWSSLGSSDSVAVTTACGHRFHCQCIDEWSGWCTQYGNRANCPICRGELETQAA